MTLGRTPQQPDLYRSRRELVESRLGERSVFRLLAAEGHTARGKVVGVMRTLLILGFLLVLLLSGPRAQASCEENRAAVYPPEKTAEGKPFLAPVNTWVWVLDYVDWAVRYDYYLKIDEQIVSDVKLVTHLVGWNDPHRSQRYRVAVLKPKQLPPRTRVSVIRYTGGENRSTKTMGTFQTGAWVDRDAPSWGGEHQLDFVGPGRPQGMYLGQPYGKLRLAGVAGDKPQEYLMVRLVNYTDQDPDTKYTTIVPYTPEVITLDGGNECAPPLIQYPPPLEPSQLEISVVDLSGNESKVSEIAFLGPHNYYTARAARQARSEPSQLPSALIVGGLLLLMLVTGVVLLELREQRK